MTKYTLVGQLPKHRYVWIDKRFVYDLNSPDCPADDFIPAVWFGLVSYPQRMWGLNVMLESGAVYRSIPPHAIAFSPTPSPYPWEAHHAQTWDCYGEQFTVIEYEYLSELGCLVRLADGSEHQGQYLFSAVPIGDGFSAYPEQSKEFSFIKLDNEERLTIQPTNHVIFREKSFTIDPPQFPKGLRRQKEVFYCE